MEVLDLLSQGPLEYTGVWQLQREIHAAVRDGTRPSTLMLLQHQSVYTAGRRTAKAERPAAGSPIPVVDVDRGGRLTWHGPGQLVGYPIIRLAEPVDPLAYVRALEQALVQVCAAYGVAAVREPGRTGVWIGARPGATELHRKIASIGARIAGGVTMHGFALNISNSLAAFQQIVACGLPDAVATTLDIESGLSLTPALVAPAVIAAMRSALGPLLDDQPAPDYRGRPAPSAGLAAESEVRRREFGRHAHALHPKGGA